MVNKDIFTVAFSRKQSAKPPNKHTTGMSMKNTTDLVMRHNVTQFMKVTQVLSNEHTSDISRNLTPDSPKNEREQILNQNEDLIKSQNRDVHKRERTEWLNQKPTSLTLYTTEHPTFEGEAKSRMVNHEAYVLVEVTTWMNIFIGKQLSLKFDSCFKEKSLVKNIQYNNGNGNLFFIQKKHGIQRICFKNVRKSGPIKQMAKLKRGVDAQILRISRKDVFVATKRHLLTYQLASSQGYRIRRWTSFKGVQEMELSVPQTLLGICACLSTKATYFTMSFQNETKKVYEMTGPCRPIFLLNGIFHIAKNPGFMKIDINKSSFIGMVPCGLPSGPFYLIGTNLFMLDSKKRQIRRMNPNKPWTKSAVVLKSPRFSHKNWFFSIL